MVIIAHENYGIEQIASRGCYGKSKNAKIQYCNQEYVGHDIGSNHNSYTYIVSLALSLYLKEETCLERNKPWNNTKGIAHDVLNKPWLKFGAGSKNVRQKA